MSEITNEAVIKVTADASGVEAGLRQVEAATTRTGKNLENLGATAQKTGKSIENLAGTSGLRNVGEGAGAAAGQVDRATKSMAESIQRATASMNAGAKGSAAYYEALANSRGLNVAALRPYLDQLDAVTKKTEQAAAAQRQLDAGNNFLAGLRAQADGIGKTASQLAALRAEQLGVADDARPLIEQLQAAEEAAGNAGSSISGFAAALASVASGAGIAAVVQLSDEYGKYVAQLKLATTGQSEFANAQGAVRRIAADAQSDLSATGALYASIIKSTRDLGIAQSQVADITETVSLALKVSGASSAEAGSAILQLSQAFASGVLRGDEFNSVNEASPRLMQALADGIGVPVGALRAMAEQGALTTDVLANALPRALGVLRTEAKSVESIGGAVTVLKNNVLELVGSAAQSNGAVSLLSGSIGLLADNLVVAGGAVATLAAAKLGSMLGVAATKAYENVAASRALAAANLATANSNVTATAAASATAAARVNELRAAVLASEGNAALAITTNGLIPAQARAAAAASAHTAALTAQAAAARAASISVGAARGALALLGGPVGAVITVLGLAATAWAVWGNAAEDANDKAKQSTEESTAEMITRLDEQIAKLRERNALAATEPRIKDLGGVSEVDKDGLARAKAALAANKAAQAEAAEGSRERMMLQLEEVELGGKYEAALARVKTLQGEVATAAARTRGERLDDWYAKNGSSAQRLAAELAELKKQFGTIPPEMEKLVRAKYADPAATKAITDQAKAAKEYADLVDRINGKSLGVDADYVENLQKLYAGYSAGKQSLAAYTATVEAYIKQQPFAKQAEEDRLRALKELSDFQDGYSKGLEATSAVYAKRVQDAEDEAKRNQELARTYGMTKSAVEQLEIAELEAQLTQRATLGLQLDQIETLEKLIDAKKRNAAAVAAMEQVDAAKKAAEEWKRAAESIEQSLTDALLRGFESGKDFGQNLVDTLKNMFGTLVLRPLIQGVLAPVSGDIAGLFPGAASGAAGAASAAPSLSQTVTSLYNSFRTGGNFEKSVANGVQVGLDKLGLSQGSGAPGALAQGVGRATSFIGGVSAGVYGGRAISGGYSVLGGSGNTAVNLGTAIGMGMGPLGAAVGGIVGGLFNRAFGRGAKESTGTTLNGMFGADGFAGTTDTTWKQDGGWFRSDKKGTDRNPVDAEFAAGLTSAYDAIKASSSAAARALGINADSIATRAQAIKIALGKDEEANQKLIAEFFTGVANTVAGELLPEIGKFQAQGEAASATLERLAVNFTAVDQILLAMGTTSLTAFRAVGTESIEARERLLTLVGGIDALATQTTFFNDNFLSEAERVAIIQKPLQEGLAALGFAGLTTADQFKSAVQGLVSSGALATEQGAKQYAGLLALAPQFKTVSDYLKSVGDAAAETARLAAEAAQKATEAARQAVLDQASGLLSGVDGAFSVLQRVVDRQKAALQDDIQARTEAVSKLRSLSDALRNSLNGIRTPEQQEADRASAMAEVRAAAAIARAGGPLPDADKLQKALAKIGNGPSTDGYATYQDYQRDLFGTQGDLAELARLTDGALTVEERSLKAVEDQAKQLGVMLEREQEQIDILKGISTTGLTIADAIRGLQGALAAARANPVVSAGAAISNAYQTHLGRAPEAAGMEYWQGAAAGGMPIEEIVNGIASSTEANLNKLYQEVLGRAPDAAGMDFFAKAYGSTMDATEVADFIKSAKNSEEYQKLRGFAVGTNQVPYDMPAYIHKDERIIPAADNRELMRRLASPGGNADALAQEVARLAGVIEAQQRENAELRSALQDGLLAVATHTSNTATHLDDIVNGRRPVVTEVVPVPA